MTALAIGIAWGLCAIACFRGVLRNINADFGVTSWGDLVSNVCWALLIVALAGPFILARWAFMATIGQRVDPAAVARRLEGQPRQTPEERIRELEARNAQLEREVGIR